MKRPRRLIPHALAGLAMVGCAQVLGLPADDEIESAARAFCKCEDLGSAWPGEDCESHVEGRLATASPEVRRAWLDLFTAEGCEQCENEEGRAKCAGTAPLCVNTAGACGATAVCCLADGDSVYCGGQGVCVKDPVDCVGPTLPCTPGETTCCGEAGQFAGCLPFDGGDTCVESCNPADPGNCEGCCVRAAIIAGDNEVQAVASLCQPEGSDCSAFCNLEGAPTCKKGTVCLPLPNGVSDGAAVWRDACMPLCNPLAGEALGSACTLSIPGSEGEQGCCVKINQGDADPVVACLRVANACTDFCDAAAADPPCACGPLPFPATEGKDITYDKCL